MIKNKGFTLVEILVVLGLFSSISTLVLGALFNAQSINVRLQETQAILDNINLSTQTITRDIRFGSDFYGTSTSPTNPLFTPPTLRKNCPESAGGCPVLIFKPAGSSNDLERVVYYLDNGILYKSEYPNPGTPTVLQMTASDVTITALTFYLKGAQTSDGSNDESGATDFEQPLVTLLISGYSKAQNSTKNPVNFNIQTTVSSREIDNK